VKVGMPPEDAEPPAASLLDQSKEGLTKATETYSKARTVAEEIIGQWASALAFGPAPSTRALPASLLSKP
jgi:hypothetical protein